MKWRVFEKSVAIGLVVAGLSSLAMPATADLSIQATLEAIQRYMCFRDYYADANPRSGETRPVTIRNDDLWAYAWMEQADGPTANASTGSLIFQSPSTPPPTRSVVFYAVYERHGRAMVAYEKSYSLPFMLGNSYFVHDKSKVFSGRTEAALLTEPTDCTPRFEDTPLKRRILKGVEQTVIQQLTGFNKHAGAQYSRQLEIVIADFNFDYPETLVWVPDEEEIFTVALHNASNPLDDTSLNDDHYPFGQIYDRAEIQALKDRILLHGIHRKIRLGD